MHEFACRSLRKIQPRSRTMAFGFVTKAEQVTTTCTRSIVIQLSMVLLSKCTMRWLLAIESGSLAFKLSRLPLFLRSYARGRAPSSSTTPRSSSHWCLRRLDHQLESSRPHTRQPGPTYSCKLYCLMEVQRGETLSTTGFQLCRLRHFCFWILRSFADL